jgi:hypothetical protein
VSKATKTPRRTPKADATAAALEELRGIAHGCIDLRDRILAFVKAHPIGHDCPACDLIREASAAYYPGVHEELQTVGYVLWAFATFINDERPYTPADLEERRVRLTAELAEAEKGGAG